MGNLLLDLIIGNKREGGREYKITIYDFKSNNKSLFSVAELLLKTDQIIICESKIFFRLIRV